MAYAIGWRIDTASRKSIISNAIIRAGQQKEIKRSTYMTKHFFCSSNHLQNLFFHP
jgi:hypothetical protein